MTVNRLDDFNEAAASNNPVESTSGFDEAGDLENGEYSNQNNVEPEIFSEDESLEITTFVGQVRELETLIKRMSEQRKDLEKGYKIALEASNVDDSAKCTAHIDALSIKLTQMMIAGRETLRNLDLVTQKAIIRQKSTEANSNNKNAANIRMRQNKHMQLATLFARKVQKIQRLQKVYRDKFRQRLIRQYLIIHPEACETDAIDAIKNKDDKSVSNNNEDPPFTLQLYASALRDEATRTMQQMQDRLADMRSIEKSLSELQRLHAELDAVVIQQNGLLNRVDVNVDTINGYMEVAVVELKDSVKLKKSLQKKLVIAVICSIFGLTIILLLILLVLRPLLMLGSGGFGRY